MEVENSSPQRAQRKKEVRKVDELGCVGADPHAGPTDADVGQAFQPAIRFNMIRMLDTGRLKACPH